MTVEDDDSWRNEIAEIPEATSNVRPFTVTAPSWRDLLIVKKKKTQAVAANAVTILRNHPAWDGVLAYDAFAEAIVKLKTPPWDEVDAPTDGGGPGEWSDNDTARAINWLIRHEHIGLSVAATEGAIATTADARVVHPVRDYLSGVRWDGKQRLPSFLASYLRCADTEYTGAIGVRWMISAVARVMAPGCQVDCTLILEGPQGIGKTSAFRALVPVPNWYADTGITIGDKDSCQNLRGVWIYGLDELDSLRRSERTRTKNFLSQTHDRYRPSYGRRARNFPRQNVFCGTTNEDAYLEDPTGDRRFWPTRILAAIDPTFIARDRDQLWAEARTRFESGEKWHVDTPALRALCEAEQEDRRRQDPWLPPIATWLANPRKGPPEMWAEDPAGVTTAEILTKALEKRRGDITRADEMRVAEVMRELKYLNRRVTADGVRVRRWVKPA